MAEQITGQTVPESVRMWQEQERVYSTEATMNSSTTSTNTVTSSPDKQTKTVNNQKMADTIYPNQNSRIIQPELCGCETNCGFTMKPKGTVTIQDAGPLGTGRVTADGAIAYILGGTPAIFDTRIQTAIATEIVVPAGTALPNHTAQQANLNYQILALALMSPNDGLGFCPEIRITSQLISEMSYWRYYYDGNSNIRSSEHFLLNVLNESQQLATFATIPAGDVRVGMDSFVVIKIPAPSTAIANTTSIMLSWDLNRKAATSNNY